MNPNLLIERRDGEILLPKEEEMKHKTILEKIELDWIRYNNRSMGNIKKRKERFTTDHDLYLEKDPMRAPSCFSLRAFYLSGKKLKPVEICFTYFQLILIKSVFRHNKRGL